MQFTSITTINGKRYANFELETEAEQSIFNNLASVPGVSNNLTFLSSELQQWLTDAVPPPVLKEENSTLISLSSALSFRLHPPKKENFIFKLLKALVEHNTISDAPINQLKNALRTHEAAPSAMKPS